MKDKGYLRFEVYSGNQTYPFPNAKITIFTGELIDSNIIQTVISDVNGDTPTIEIQTTPLKESLTPGTDDAYTTINALVEAPGFFSSEYINIPIFNNNVSIQPVQMIPIPKGNENKILQYNITQREPY